mmetsp:Transcript_33077/g.102662  ORF Transcript_33077/g.102662 Transcript_33077/m.102662 type:complete len:163 (+) Transcript_33077:200-688(+)|eukprot:CAMPEP_0204593318 /NCGR_PEP_ID=MMETSP0661-20131031/51438_1 /ASSEMBLY_ACC=CAM_ASM_000606 /TAXON_ID=109239 /ORGANISM="Alexandrium margalefi, Strain AMGDE01CS-322" /LENGTH=162 /DNA_ID=CAMNT_0051603613 /DNA_START=200 /DNA_END=688 /DNA_ORIENTATION=+
MKPTWDRLMAEYEDSETLLVADVDCIAEGRSKCQEVGITSFPTIKYGDPSDLQTYEGGPSFEELKQFAEDIRPQCGAARPDLCDAAMRAQIEELKALTEEEREAMIKRKTEDMMRLEADFRVLLEGMNERYYREQEKKDAAVEALRLLKAVHSYMEDSAAEL